VALSAQLIKPLIQNHVILGVQTTSNGRYANSLPEGFADFVKVISLPKFTEGQEAFRVLNIKTKGKFMYWEFTDDWYLFSTFGMSGQWSNQVGKHPCIIFQHTEEITSNSVIHQMAFNDPRHFGTVRFVHGRSHLDQKLNELGWDPLQMPLTDNLPWLKQQLSKTNKPIAQVLMDQKIFAGVGNYIKSESLYKAKLSPWRSSKSLTETEVLSLCQAIIAVVNKSLEFQGATILTYKGVYGEEGRYSSCFEVYGRKTDPLGNPITAETTPDKRTTHWCPTIQK
jgi:formamidopyrimidine-DNA glycosylase